VFQIVKHCSVKWKYKTKLTSNSYINSVDFEENISNTRIITANVVKDEVNITVYTLTMIRSTASRQYERLAPVLYDMKAKVLSKLLSYVNYLQTC
jgi:hypothetical protein